MTARGRTRARGTQTGERANNTATFDCHWQCAECGFQLPVEADQSAGGYRQHAELGPKDQPPQEPCGGCGERAWANLRQGAIIEALELQDEQRQELLRGRRDWTRLVLPAFGWLGLGFAAANAADTRTLLLIGGLSVATSLMSYWRANTLGEQLLFANAWHHAHQPRGHEQSVARGKLEAAGELRAPLSGRRCVAYELGIRHDSNPHDVAGSWTLLEQRCAPGLQVAGREPERTPYLRVHRRRFEGELDARARRALRKRGLDPDRPGYTLFETLVEVGTRAHLLRHEHGLVLSTV